MSTSTSTTQAIISATEQLDTRGRIVVATIAAAVLQTQKNNETGMKKPAAPKESEK